MSVTVQKDGDLFTCGADAITCTVNCVGVMGKGVALEFKKRYPQMFLPYTLACKTGILYPGKVWVWYENPLYIVNFPTKFHWRDPSKLEWIKDGLHDLKNHVIIEKIKILAMPALGCQNGGLRFEDVRSLVEDAFGESKLEVTLFEPQ